MESTERMLFNNVFGSITDKRVILNHKNGQEDILIKQITSVSFKHERNITFAILGFIVFLLSLGSLITYRESLTFLGIIVFTTFTIMGLLSSISNWLGHHNIVISVSGNERKPLKVEMSKTKEGKDFIIAINNATLR
jgi:hypothetical protein